MSHKPTIRCLCGIVNANKKKKIYPPKSWSFNVKLFAIIFHKQFNNNKSASLGGLVGSAVGRMKFLGFISILSGVYLFCVWFLVLHRLPPEVQVSSYSSKNRINYNQIFVIIGRRYKKTRQFCNCANWFEIWHPTKLQLCLCTHVVCLLIINILKSIFKK